MNLIVSKNGKRMILIDKIEKVEVFVGVINCLNIMINGIRIMTIG